jgi:hypothetical protein
MIPGVYIGGKHCWNDYGMILAKKTIGLPTAQTYSVEVPGRNGLLDLSEALTGGVVYSNRTISLSFVTAEKFSGKSWADFLSFLSNDVHGRKTKIVFDEDATYYYTGRGTVETTEFKNGKMTVSLSFDCEPYKLKMEPTVVTAATTTTEQTIILSNDRKAVTPTITATKETTLAYNGVTAVVNANTPVVLTDLVLGYGQTEVTVKSTKKGTITFEYQEGSL